MRLTPRTRTWQELLHWEAVKTIPAFRTLYFGAMVGGVFSTDGKYWYMPPNHLGSPHGKHDFFLFDKEKGLEVDPSTWKLHPDVNDIYLPAWRIEKLGMVYFEAVIPPESTLPEIQNMLEEFHIAWNDVLLTSTDEPRIWFGYDSVPLLTWLEG